MNPIAAQLDYIADELRLTTRILEAREKYRQIEAAVSLAKPGTFRSVANEMACNQLAHVIRLEREYRDNFGPADEVTK